MHYTKKYPQTSKAGARAKFRRMLSGVGRFNQNHFECAFSTWWIGEDEDDENSANLVIYVSSNYHATSTLDRMYKTNCKSW